MQTALRYLVMLQHIPRQPQKIDPASLREKLYSQGFAVTVRTIQRDLNELSEVFPLVTDERSKPFGWSFLADSPISLPSLDMPTAMALLLMEQQLKLMLPSALLRKLQSNFNAARKLLEDTSSGYDKWLERVHVVQRGVQLTPAEFQPCILDAVYQALENRVQLQLTYHSRSDGDERNLTVNPLGIVHRNAVTYLVCQFKGQQDIRQLALQRITSIMVGKAKAEIPENFDLADHLQGGQLNLPRTKNVQSVTLKFDKQVGRHLYEAPLCREQSIEQFDGHLIVRANICLTDELVWWLLSFGAQVEVLAPTQLRMELKRQVSAMQSFYEDG